MPQMLLINPRRRRKAKANRRARRPMTALQLKYFGKRRRNPMSANPHGRKRRRRPSASMSTSLHRSTRRARRTARNVGARIGFSLPALTSAAKVAATGAVGAVAADVLMGQAGKILPATWMSRTNTDGSINWAYYGTKAAISVGMGVAAARLGGGRFGAFGKQAALGAITVQGYELLRMVLPADLVTLGYYNPGRIATGSVPAPGRVVQFGKYFPTRAGAGTQLSRMRGVPSRIGAR